jgi:hypothetical protein
MNKDLGVVRDWHFVRMTKDSGYQGKAILQYTLSHVLHIRPRCITFPQSLDSTIRITVYCPKCTPEPRFIVDYRVRGYKEAFASGHTDYAKYDCKSVPASTPNGTIRALELNNKNIQWSHQSKAKWSGFENEHTPRSAGMETRAN